ncbi:MAG: DUF4097 family beta strand repeat-containing protein [Acidobacteriia bacterium]|nr:DUF4097 family beta strand repeat-containing protein [Terriglobia bacterium]
MAMGANGQPRRSSLFSALVLILFGTLFLLHNYRGGVNFAELIHHWWPVLLILWGVSKLYERTMGRREGAKAPTVTAGEIFLVLGMLTLVGVFALAEILPGKIQGTEPLWGSEFTYDAAVAPRAVSPTARIAVRIPRGNITVHTADTPELKVAAQKRVRAWSEARAESIANGVRIEIAPDGDDFEVRTSGTDTRAASVSVDLEITVPRKAALTIRDERGDVEVNDAGSELAISTRYGDVTVLNAGAGVSVELGHGDVRVSGVKGNVKISGKGGEVEVSEATGGLTLDGEFYGPIRAEKVAKGVRFISSRTDLTLTQLNGRMEASSGNLDISKSSGDLTLRTKSYVVSLEDVTGRMNIENRGGDVSARFTTPPMEEIEITNKSASISLTLPRASTFELSAECRSGDIDSEFEAPTLKKTTGESGGARLEGKVGTRGPRITLKTSYGSIGLHKGS